MLRQHGSSPEFIDTQALLYSLSPDSGACSAGAVRTQRAVLTGLLFLCSTVQGQVMLESASSLFLLEETVFGLVYANDIDVRLHAAKVLLKAAQQPRIACFMCDRQPLHGLFACLGSNCDTDSKRVVCIMLQLMLHLLACDAARRMPQDFVEHLPFLLERVERAYPDPDDPVRVLVEPVRMRLQMLVQIYREASGTHAGFGDYGERLEALHSLDMGGGGALRGAMLQRQQQQPPASRGSGGMPHDRRRRSLGPAEGGGTGGGAHCIIS